MAITTVTPTRLLLPRNTRLVFASGVSVATTSDLSTLFDSGTGKAVSALTKNITLTPPETAHDLQSFLGVDANSFQNQLFEGKPPTVATITGTMIVDEDEAIEAFLDTSPITVTGGYTRYQIGNAQSEQTDILVNISGATGTVNMAMIDSEITKHGDYTLSGPDSHWEVSITAVCLAKNFYWEYKD